MISYVNFLLDKNDTKAYIQDTLWPAIKLDLHYIHDNWNQTTLVTKVSDIIYTDWKLLLRFDLWEEISSSSFWTAVVQHKALRKGIALANNLRDDSSVPNWTEQADNILCFMQVKLEIFLPCYSDPLDSHSGLTMLLSSLPTRAGEDRASMSIPS